MRYTLLLFLLAGCAGPQGEDAAPSVEPLLTLDLSTAEESVRVQLERQRDALDEKLRQADADPQEIAQAFADLGLLYMTYEILEPAGTCFRNAGLLAPDDYRWHYLSGYLEMTRGNLPEAVELYEKTLILKPDFLPAILRLGRSHLDLGRYEEAGAAFERSRQGAPEVAAAYAGLAKAAAALGDDEVAVGHFEHALVLEPQADSLHYALAQSYRNLGRLEKAREHLARRGDVATWIVDPLINPLANLAESVQFYRVQGAEAMEDGRHGDAAASFRAALERDEKSFGAYRGLGLSLQRMGDLEGAVRTFEEALDKATTGDVDEDKAERAGVLRTLASYAARRGREAEMLERYLQSLAEVGDQPDVLLLAGNALGRAGRFKEALTRYDRLIELEPEWAPAVLEKRATALVNLGRGDEAVADFERAVAAAPEQRSLRLHYAEALKFLGRGEEAVRQKNVADSLPVSDAERAATAVAAARRSTREGDFEAAIKAFGDALKIRPDDLETRFALASVLGHVGRFAQAVDELEKVIVAAPRHDGARRSQIGALILVERYGEARIKLQEALRAFPRHTGFALVQVRLLSTAPDASVRDGELALKIAERMRVDSEDIAVRQALALAYAAAGRFSEAAKLQQEILAEDEAAGAQDWIRLGKARLVAFEQGEVWEARSPQEILAP
jgi:tetratricopeptide (TPR) repeat protein